MSRCGAQIHIIMEEAGDFDKIAHLTKKKDYYLKKDAFSKIEENKVFLSWEIDYYELEELLKKITDLCPKCFIYGVQEGDYHTDAFHSYFVKLPTDIEVDCDSIEYKWAPDIECNPTVEDFIKFADKEEIYVPAKDMLYIRKMFGEDVDFGLLEIKELEVKKLKQREFSDFLNITKLNFSSITKTIPKLCFSNTGIEELTVPQTIKSLGEEAFSYCGSLQTVVIEGATKISRRAFKNAGLKSITFQDSVSFSGMEVFLNCNNLEKVVFEGKVNKIPPKCFKGCKNLQEVIGLENVDEIGPEAFAGCKKLQKCSLSKDVILDESAFKGCKNFK